MVCRAAQRRHREDDLEGDAHVPARLDPHNPVVRRCVRGGLGIRLVRVYPRARGEQWVEGETEEPPLARRVRVREGIERSPEEYPALDDANAPRESFREEDATIGGKGERDRPVQPRHVDGDLARRSRGRGGAEDREGANNQEEDESQGQGAPHNAGHAGGLPLGCWCGIR